MKKIAIVVATLLVAACSSTPTKVEAPQTTPQTMAMPASTTAAAPVAQTDANSLSDQIQQLQQQSVYFDFDQSVVKSDYQNVVQNQASFVKSHPNDVVTVQGNTDERGSSEYNLALGSRRAFAVKQALEVSGVNSSQIKTVSFGEEKPRLTCHEEKCWKENRRADFVHDMK